MAAATSTSCAPGWSSRGESTCRSAPTSRQSPTWTLSTHLGAVRLHRPKHPLSGSYAQRCDAMLVDFGLFALRGVGSSSGFGRWLKTEQRLGRPSCDSILVECGRRGWRRELQHDHGLFHLRRDEPQSQETTTRSDPWLLVRAGTWFTEASECPSGGANRRRTELTRDSLRIKPIPRVNAACGTGREGCSQ